MKSMDISSSTIQDSPIEYATINTLVKILEYRDKYTRGHSRGVATYAGELAVKLGFSELEVMEIRTAGWVHDIGKIGIRDNILLKPGKLTKEEFEIIKEHPLIGSQIVAIIQPLWKYRRVDQYVRHHHERFNGTGYPDMLMYDEIPLGARIMAVADVYDAMTTPRVYREKTLFTPQEAIEEMLKDRGKYFDHLIIDAFAQWLQESGNI